MTQREQVVTWDGGDGSRVQALMAENERLRKENEQLRKALRLHAAALRGEDSAALDV